MNKLLKNISIIFGCLGLCALLSVPCILSIDRKAEQTRAADSDSSIYDLIKYDRASHDENPMTFDSLEANLCYSFTFDVNDLPDRNRQFTPVYFETYGQVFTKTNSISLALVFNRGDFLLNVVSSGSTLFTIPVSSDFYIVFDTAMSFVNLSGMTFGNGKVILESTYSIYVSILSEINSLESSIVALQNEKAVLQGRITSLNSTLATAQSNITSLQFQISALNFDKLELQNQITLLEYQISNKQGVIEELHAEIDELESQIEDLESEIEDLEDDVYYWNNEYTTAHNSLLQLQNSVSSLTTTIDNLRASLSAREEEIETLSAFNGVFGIIRSAFNGVVPLLDFQLAPGLSIGAILTIPFVLAILGFILKALG